MQFQHLKLWIVSYKHASFKFHKTLIDGVVWITVMFLSAVWIHSDGTHSLQMIHWWASHVKLNFSKCFPMKKQTHLYVGWPEGD